MSAVIKMKKSTKSTKWQRSDVKMPAEALIMDITPELAAQMLEIALPNRHRSEGLVESYRDSMRADWVLNGETIKFDWHGQCLDGQHRLEACIKSSTTFRTFVALGLDPLSQDTVDIGRARSASDVLSIHGIPYAARTASAARWLYIIKSGRTEIKNKSHTKVLEIFRRHRQIGSSASIVEGAFGPPPSLLVALHYIGSHILGKEQEADHFVRVFVNGKTDIEECVAWHWRERLVHLKAARLHIQRSEHLCGLVHAWNKFSKGEGAAKLVIPTAAVIDDLDLDLL